MLPGSNEHDAEKVAENCRLAVQALQFRVKDDLVPLTVSAGVAAWVPTVEGAYKQLLNAADTALYRDKNAGRNCVKTASDRGKLASI